MARLSASES